MRMIFGVVRSALACTLVAATGFAATAYAELLATGARPGLITADEAASIYGAQCAVGGGADCTASNGNNCGTTGCRGGTQCGLDPNGVTCSQISPGGSPVNDCRKALKNGNCFASCSGGCTFYATAYAVATPNGPICSACNVSYVCGDPVCTTRSTP